MDQNNHLTAPPSLAPTSELKYDLKKNIGELDMMANLNTDFNEMVNKCISILSADENRMDLTSEIKKTIVKVLETLHKQYMNEKHELQSHIIEADEKFNLALKLSTESQEAINSMKQQLENAWKISDASQIREQNLETQLTEMILKCKPKTEDKIPVQEIEKDSELGKLTKYKHIILKERDRLQAENMELNRRLKMDRIYREEVDKHCEDVEERVDKIQKLLDVAVSKQLDCEKRLNRLNEEFDESKEFNENLLIKCDEYELKIQEHLTTINKKSLEFDRMRSELEKVKNEHANLNKQHLIISTQLSSTLKDKKTLQEQYKNLKDNLKAKSAEALQKGTKLKKCENDYNNLTVNVTKMNKTIHNLKEDILKLNNKNENLEKSLLEFTGKYHNLEILKQAVTYERDNLRTDIIKANNKINDMQLLEKLKKNEIDNLKLNNQKLNIKLDDTKRIIEQVNKEKDEQAQEIQGLNDKIFNIKEQLKLKFDHIIDLNEQLNNKQSAYVQIQKLLETTNSERLILQKSLQNCSEEKSNLKNLLSKTNLQIIQLSKEITSNQNKINSLNLQIERLRSEKQNVETELHSNESLLHSIRVELKEMKQRNENLSKIITEDEMKFMKLTIQLEDVKKEKNLIGLQMVRRNDEIILLKERLEICQGALDRGEMQYNQRVEDIRLLKLEISDLQTQRNLFKKSLETTANTKVEIIRLQKTLTQEKIKNRVLFEDLNTPTNVHRWRILSGSDPDRYQLIEKVQFLQKQICKQQIEGIKMENMLKESRKIYLSMKKYIQKLPLYDIKTDLVQSQNNLRKREKQMKALAAEITILYMDVNRKDDLIEKLSNYLLKSENENYSKLIIETKGLCCEEEESNFSDTPRTV